MIIVAGCLIVKNNKILMVQEAQKQCYGQWNLPAGCVDEHELITDAAIRETFEETGCKVELTGLLPIPCVYGKNGQTLIRITFTADMLEETIQFDKNEILDVKWIDIEEVKNMKKEELKGYERIIKAIEAYENNKIYSVEIFDNTEFDKM